MSIIVLHKKNWGVRSIGIGEIEDRIFQVGCPKWIWPGFRWNFDYTRVSKGRHQETSPKPLHSKCQIDISWLAAKTNSLVKRFDFFFRFSRNVVQIYLEKKPLSTSRIFWKLLITIDNHFWQLFLGVLSQSMSILHIVPKIWVPRVRCVNFTEGDFFSLFR